MATYVPNASDNSQPQVDKTVYSAAEEFRAIKTRMNVLAASTATGELAPGGLDIPDFVLNSSTPNGRAEFASTNPLAWNTASGSMMIHCNLQFTGYFAANPNGHMAIVLRQDPTTIATSVRGNGAAFGNLTGAQNGTQVNPGAQIESWANSMGSPQGDNNLIPGADLGPGAALADGVNYLVILESVVTKGGDRKIRLAMYQPNNTGVEWGIMLDTGYVVDSNITFDPTKTMLVFAHVFPSNLVPWSISVSSLRVTWGPAPVEAAANMDRLSIFGGTVTGDLEITGNTNVTGVFTVNGAPVAGGAVEPLTLTQPLTFTGTANSIKLNSAAGAYASWGYIQNSVLNDNTVVMSKPNGTAVNSNFLSANRNNLASAFGYIATGMAGALAVTETLGVNGHATPDYSVKIGGVTSCTFTSGGVTSVPFLNVAGASTNLGTIKSTGLFNLGGTNATVLWDAPQNMEGLATAGVIGSTVGGAGVTVTGALLEIATRPLYAYLSVLIAELKNRKVL